jgi:type II secretory pathway component PulF
MPKYQYQAMAQSGEAMAGTIEADSPEQAQALLDAMHVKVYSLEPAPKAAPRTRLGRTEFLLFNQQLASITKAGLPLEKALRQVAKDVQSPRLRRAIDELAGDLEKGTPLEEAFTRHERSFPHLYGRIIKAGVQTGRLSEMLFSLNRHQEMAVQTRRIVLDALTYPLVVLVLASIILTGMLAYVVPQFKEFVSNKDFFANQSVSIPVMTEALFWMADHVWLLWCEVGGFVAAIIVLYLVLHGSRGGRRFWERVVLGIPALGRVVLRTHMARLADAMAILVGAGCDLPTAVRLAGGACGSPNLQIDCEVLAQAVEAGLIPDTENLSARYLPAMMLYSIRIGSQRNELEANLYSLADMYGRQARQLQGNLQALLLPVMIVVLGGILACAITALMGPMVTLVRFASAF